MSNNSIRVCVARENLKDHIKEFVSRNYLSPFSPLNYRGKGGGGGGGSGGQNAPSLTHLFPNNSPGKIGWPNSPNTPPPPSSSLRFISLFFCQKHLLAHAVFSSCSVLLHRVSLREFKFLVKSKMATFLAAIWYDVADPNNAITHNINLIR